MDLFNIIAGVCSILGLLISCFTLTKVINITTSINVGDKSNIKSTIENIKTDNSENVTIAGGNVHDSKQK